MPIVTLPNGARVDTGFIKGRTGSGGTTVTPKPVHGGVEYKAETKTRVQSGTSDSSGKKISSTKETSKNILYDVYGDLTGVSTEKNTVKVFRDTKGRAVGVEDPIARKSYRVTQKELDTIEGARYKAQKHAETATESVYNKNKTKYEQYLDTVKTRENRLEKAKQDVYSRLKITKDENIKIRSIQDLYRFVTNKDDFRKSYFKESRKSLYRIPFEMASLPVVVAGRYMIARKLYQGDKKWDAKSQKQLAEARQEYIQMKIKYHDEANKAVIHSLDPRDPEGFTNLVVLASEPAARIAKDVYIKAGSKKIPLSDITTAKGAEGKLIKSSSVGESLKEFKSNPKIRDVLIKEKEVPGWSRSVRDIDKLKEYEVVHASPEPIKSGKIKAGPKAEAGFEDPGLYVGAEKKAQVAFTKATGELEVEYTLNPFKRSTNNKPSLTYIRVSDIKRMPKRIIERAGFRKVGDFAKKTTAESVAYITKRSELGQSTIKKQWFKILKDTKAPWNNMRIIREGELLILKRNAKIKANDYVLEPSTTEMEGIILTDKNFVITKKSLVSKIKGFDEYTEMPNKQLVRIYRAEVGPPLEEVPKNVIEEFKIKKISKKESDSLNKKYQKEINNYSSESSKPTSSKIVVGPRKVAYIAQSTISKSTRVSKSNNEKLISELKQSKPSSKTDFRYYKQPIKPLSKIKSTPSQIKMPSNISSISSISSINPGRSILRNSGISKLTTPWSITPITQISISNIKKLTAGLSTKIKSTKTKTKNMPFFKYTTTIQRPNTVGQRLRYYIGTELRG